MKQLITIALMFLSMHVFAQTETFDELLKSGKEEFKKDYESQDFSIAAANLERAVSLRPTSAAAHYFLGYAYSRINAKDGEMMLGMSLPLLLKTSEEFEKVNKLTPKYTGELIVLDPYSKISSEWGSMAMKYLYSNELDSAKWAFTEGKKRGGFGVAMLQLAKNSLDACSSDAILFTFGDSWTFPLWYVQNIDDYRKDVAVIDAGLINAAWYPSFLVKNKIVDFGRPIAELDTLKYAKWTDKNVTIKNIKNNSTFTWTINSNGGSGYLYRGDRLLLSLLKNNEFKRDIYFTRLYDDDSRLSLSEHIIKGVSVDKLNTGKEENLSYEKYKTELSKNLNAAKLINLNNESEIDLMSSIRYPVYMQAKKYIEADNLASAKEILVLLNSNLPYDRFPISNEFKMELDRLLKLTN